MASQKETKIINRMAQLGFTKYEAKAYITLLEYAGISAYEISKKSGVPQSKIYETVKGLVEEGIIIAQGDNPVLYSPLPLQEFIRRYRQKLEDNLSSLEEELKDFGEQPEIDYMWHFYGLESCLEKARELVNGSNRTLFLEIWEEELNKIKPELEKAKERGVDLVTVYYGEKIDLPGKVFSHRLEGLHQSATAQGRWLTVISDHQDGFFGSFGGEKTEAVWTQNKAFMLMAESFINHDIFISEIDRVLGAELDREFGPNLSELRDELQK